MRAPWSTALADLGTPEVATALRLSLVCSLAATACSIALGLPLAWLLARSEVRGRGLLRGLVMLPVVLPPVVGGVALLLAFGRRGIVGRWLDAAFGVTLPFTTAGAVLAETFVAMPFFVLTIEGARGLDVRLEDAARTLGARPWVVFRRVTLPLLRPSLAAGAVLCWARALGEFGATITFAGNFSRPHADAAARGVRGAREQARGRHPAEPRAAGDLARGAGRAAAPLARGSVSLHARIAAARGAFRLTADLEVGDGEIVAVLGPDGRARRRCCARSPG